MMNVYELMTYLEYHLNNGNIHGKTIVTDMEANDLEVRVSEDDHTVRISRAY